MHNLGHLEKTLVGEVGSKLLKSFISSESAVRAEKLFTQCKLQCKVIEEDDLTLVPAIFAVEC